MTTRRLPLTAEAAIIQVAALAGALVAVAGAAAAGVAVPVWAPVFAQGILAAILTAVRALPWWWIPIQASFLPAAWLLRQADPPVWPFPVAFAVLAGFYWSTYRTRVPLYLSGAPVWETFASVLPAEAGLRVVDIGAGLGGVMLDIERRRPDCGVDGIEIAPFPWALARLRLALAGSRCRLFRGDYARLDLSAYDVVFAFLSPAAMPALWQQARAQMRPGTRLVSCEFEVPGAPADRALAVPGQSRRLHVWLF